MAYHYNPHIVQDGLVLCMDAKDSLARGPNLIPDGEFTNGTTGWLGYAGTTLSRVGASVDPGAASGGSDDYCMKVSGPYMAYIAIKTVIGKSYWVTLRGYEGGGDPGRNSLKISNTSDGGNLSGTSEVYITPDATWVAKTQTFTATATTTYIRVGANSGGGGGSNLSYFDSIYVYEMLWKDLSGNGNNGAVNNTVYQSGSIEHFDFDGTDDYVQIGDSSSMALGYGNVTFMAWVNFNSVSGNQVIIGDEGGSGDTSQNNFHLFMLFDEGSVGQVSVRGHSLSPNQYNFILHSTNNAVSAGNWYHLVGVLDRGSTSSSKIYVNGVDKTNGTTNFDSGANSMDFSYWSLGRRTNVGDFDLNAKVASVVQYNRALSQEEVLQNFYAQRGRFGV